MTRRQAPDAMPAMKLTIVLPWHPDGKLAENRRREMHWAAYADLLAQERGTAYLLLREQLGPEPPQYERIRLTTQWAFKKRGPAPDYENLVAREKVIVDCTTGGSRYYRGLGIVADDNWEHVVARSMLAPLTGQERDELRIWIEEA